MNVSKKKGSSGKFLALLASLSMIMVGLVGVMVASPASAEGTWVQVSLNQTGSISADKYKTGECTNVPADRDGWHFVVTQSEANKDFSPTFDTSDWAVVSTKQSGGVGHIYVSTPIGAVLSGGSATTVVGNYLGDPGPFNLSHTCPGTPAPTSSLTVDKAWVGTNGAASEELAGKLDSSDAGALTVTVDGSATGQAWGATESGLTPGDQVVVSEGTVSQPSSDLFPEGYTCSLDTDGYPTIAPNDFALAEGSNSVTVTNAVECTADGGGGGGGGGGGSTPESPETPTVVEEATVETPAQVTVPQPATVVPPAKKPTKKPAKVVLPATIPAGVANVSAPESATIPSAVPAGGGSQAPGVPMWALAMIVVGALGAAGAGMKVLGARE